MEREENAHPALRFGQGQRLRKVNSVGPLKSTRFQKMAWPWCLGQEGEVQEDAGSPGLRPLAEPSRGFHSGRQGAVRHAFSKASGAQRASIAERKPGGTARSFQEQTRSRTRLVVGAQGTSSSRTGQRDYMNLNSAE